MKAKRILSLLLTVAMMLTCVTAFAAAPAEYIQTVTTDIKSAGQPLAGVRSESPYLTFDVSYLSDADLGGYTPQQYGAPEGWSNCIYVVKMKINDLGTLNHLVTEVQGGPPMFETSYSYSGYKLVFAQVKLNYGENVKFLSDATGNKPEVNYKANSKDMGTYYLWQYSDTNAETAYPANGTSDITKENAAINAFTFYFASKDPGGLITVNGANVMFNNYLDGEVKDTTGATFTTDNIGLYHPATFTLGEAADDGDDAPVFGKAEVDSESGVAIKGQDTVKYDNAYTVKATITPGNAKAIGVLFIPAKVAEKDTEWATAAKATLTGTAMGNGTVAMTYAIKGIPRKHAAGITMLAKAYAELADGSIVADDEHVVTTNVTFGDTGEVVE